MLFKHVLCFARIMSTLCPNSCRQTARIGGGGATAPPAPRPVRLCTEPYTCIGLRIHGEPFANTIDVHEYNCQNRDRVASSQNIYYRRNTMNESIAIPHLLGSVFHLDVLTKSQWLVTCSMYSRHFVGG